MITTGTKYFLGISTAAAVGLTLYAIATGWGAMGTVGLLTALVALGFLVWVASSIRDGDVPADADAATIATSGAAQRAPGASPWPAVVGVGLAVVAVGMVTLPAIFILGIVVLLAGLAEWLVQAWAEGASSDPAYNERVRGRMAYPLELPIAGALLLGVVVYGFSRLVLAVSKETGPLLFGVAGALVLLFGFLIARRPNLSKGVVGGMCAIALIGLAAGGVATALSGERQSLTDAVEEDHFAVENRECDENAHEFDEKASQTIAATANAAAYVFLTEEGLHAEQVGIPGELTSITLQRSNPSTILFFNKTPEERRLNLELEQVQIEGTDAFEQRVLCTSLVEQDGSQSITVTIGLPSATSEVPFRLVVPGVDGTEIEIVVP